MKKILLGFIAIGLLTFVGCKKDDDIEATKSDLNFDRYYFDRSIAEDIIKLDSVVLLTKNGKSNPTNFRVNLSFQNSLNTAIFGIGCDTLIVGEDFELIRKSLEAGYNINFIDSLNLSYANGNYKREENQISFSGVYNYYDEEIVFERLFIKENNQYVVQLFCGEAILRGEDGSLLQIFGFTYSTEPTFEFLVEEARLRNPYAVLDSVYFRKSQIPFVLEK